MTHPHTKSEVSSFIHSKDMEGVPYVTSKIDIAHAQYDVKEMLGVKTNVTFGFLIPIFPIHYSLCNVWEAIMKNKRCFLLTPMLSSSHYPSIENGFSGVKRGD